MALGLRVRGWVTETGPGFPAGAGTVGAVTPRQVTGTIVLSVQETSLLVDYILRKLREDQVQRVDYALQSAGEAGPRALRLHRENASPVWSFEEQREHM